MNIDQTVALHANSSSGQKIKLKPIPLAARGISEESNEVRGSGGERLEKIQEETTSDYWLEDCKKILNIHI